jgi:hypothetical protein
MHKLQVLHKNIDIDSTMIFLCICHEQKWGAEMAIFGYARVSTDGQTLASQDAQLHAAGCAKSDNDNIGFLQRRRHGLDLSL